MSLTIDHSQMDILCLRERDLLNRFSAEVSQYQAQGVSTEQAFTLVRMHLFFNIFIYCYLTLIKSVPPFRFRSLFYISHSFPFFFKTYQIAEDLGKAFADLAILKTFLEAEEAESASQLKVLRNCHYIFCKV